MNVYSVADTQDAIGGPTLPETKIHSSVPCLIEVLSGSERQRLGREGLIVTHMIYADTTNAIVEKNVIKMDSDSKIFDVIQVDNVQERDHHYEILVMERT
jgi:head-tail adaptor